MPDGDMHIHLLWLAGEDGHIVIFTICRHGDFVSFGYMDTLDGHADVFLAITIAYYQIGSRIGGTCDSGSTFGLVKANVAGGFFINR